MTQFLKKVFMHTTVYNYVFLKKDIFYKYLKISEYLIAKNWPFIKLFNCYIKTNKKILRWGFLGEVQNYFPFVMGSDRTRTLLWEMSELCNGQCSN